MFKPDYIIAGEREEKIDKYNENKIQDQKPSKKIIEGLFGTGRRELGHRLGTLGDGVLSQFTREDETDSSLDFS